MTPASMHQLRLHGLAGIVAAQRRQVASPSKRTLIPGGPNRMSHVVTIQTHVRNPVAIAAACHRLGLAEPTHGTAQLFSGEAAGLLLQLPGWTYDFSSPRVADGRPAHPA
jgi:hypothetical protein